MVRFCVRIALAIVLAPAVGLAAETTWEVRGSLTEVGDVFPIGLTPGTPYRMIVTFDNAVSPWRALPIVCNGSGCQSPVPGQTPTGYRYDYVQPALKMVLFAGAECAPCIVEPPGGGNLIVRDGYPVAPGTGAVPTDGISFVARQDGLDYAVILRTQNLALGIVNGPGMPYQAPAGLGALTAASDVAVTQLCTIADPYCDQIAQGGVAAVANPTYGLGYILTARDCRIPAITDLAIDPRPYDCINLGAQRANTWSDPGGLRVGGGLGFGDLLRHYQHTTSTIDASWNDGLGTHAALGLPELHFGTLYAKVTFGGPVALPVFRGASYPWESSRLNTNLFAFQKYNYSGGVTALPLMLALTYFVRDYSNDPVASPQFPDRPGGAAIGATMSIIDGSVHMEEVQQAGRATFRLLTCGSEALFGWPAGSILGAATIDTPEHEFSLVGSASRVIESCANPGQPVQLAPNQGFIVATGIQLPARGRLPQPPHAVAAPDNGIADSRNTLRVVFDPAAPAALVRALADSITPACTDCGLEPEVQAIAIDIKPGSGDNCINPDSRGVIPVALLGDAGFAVANVRLDDSLRLGSLALRVRGAGPLCSVSAVNDDAYPDLVCHFDNAADGWQAGQSAATVTGRLNDGVPFTGSDNICLVR